MGENNHWTCPFCDRDTIIRDDDIFTETCFLEKQSIDGHRAATNLFIVCPNPACRRFVLNVSLRDAHYKKEYGKWGAGDVLQTWQLIPSSKAKTYPKYIPPVILDDYSEACLIADLSPKASATLSRRCLQGILRDFWKVKPSRLVDEIKAIEDKVEPEIWAAIDAVRKVGNIGAHMEADVNVIVDVDPDEAQLLIQLIETLLKEWYIARQKRQERLKAITEMAAEKDARKKTKPHGS